jgi:hypothetical protein
MLSGKGEYCFYFSIFNFLIQKKYVIPGSTQEYKILHISWDTCFKFLLSLCCVWVHYGIYESSYNISNISFLYSPPPPFPFISPQQFLAEFQELYFSIYIYMCTVLLLEEYLIAKAWSSKTVFPFITATMISKMLVALTTLNLE